MNLAGFVAPLNLDDDIVTEFLLVPYFGACIHVPAPPPNQTVLVTVDKANGLTFDESWGAVWVAGTLTIDHATTDLATASYTMSDATSGLYEYGWLKQDRSTERRPRRPDSHLESAASSTAPEIRDRVSSSTATSGNRAATGSADRRGPSER